MGLKMSVLDSYTEHLMVLTQALLPYSIDLLSLM